MHEFIPAIKHTHILLVCLFVLHTLIKCCLLTFAKGGIPTYKKYTKLVGDMIIPTAFIILGLMLLGHSEGVYGSLWFKIKLIGIVMGLLVGLLGFKTGFVPFAWLSFLIFVYIIVITYAKNPMPSAFLQGMM